MARPILQSKGKDKKTRSLFKLALNDVREQKKSFPKFDLEEHLLNPSSSKDTSVTFIADSNTNSVTCQKKCFSPTDETHKDYTKETAYCTQSLDENKDVPASRTPRHPKDHISSNYQKFHPSNTKKNYFKFSQNADSQNESLSRSNRICNTSQYFKLQDGKAKLGNRLEQSTNVQDEMVKDIIDNNLNLKQSFEEENPENKYQRKFSELNEPVLNGRFKNMKITFQTSASDSFSDISPDLRPSLNSSISDASVSTISNISTNELDDQNVTNATLEISSYEDFIPPPVSCELPSTSEKTEYDDRDMTYFQKMMPKEVDSSSLDETHFDIPDLTHFEGISNFIEKVLENRSVPSCAVADKVVYDLNVLFKEHFEGNVIDYYGSYYSGLAISTSNVNIYIKADQSLRKSFMYEIYKILSKERKYHVHQYEEGPTAYKTKIYFTHPNTGINCELAYLGKNEEKFLKMGKFLKEMCRKDERTKLLIITVKVWAEHFNINEVEDGKLHPIGFDLLVIHFLQHCKNPVLPIYASIEQNMKSLSNNVSSIGELWLDFLRYYTFEFNWHEDVLTVTSVERVPKKSKKWENYWIAVEDPFTGKNIASSVMNKDVADYIRFCFKKTFFYFLYGPEIDKESESNHESGSSQMEFSFNDCIIEQNEDTCEICYEIDDVCTECKKKLYVQPITAMPKMTDDFLKIINKTLLTVHDKYMLSDQEVKQRKQFVKQLESEVRKIYFDAQMSLIGSSANGFGFKMSDLDICMTFKSNEFKAAYVLKDLRYLLRRNRNYVNVIAIFNAKIPILKFHYEPERWRCDISLNNVLAVHNSELLYTYSLIDERCKILGCALKLITKKAFIAGVTEKALSSYSYLIMVIHFLQQTDPPVLPVLQDIQFRKGGYQLDDIVDNCNVWFCKDISYIKRKATTKNNTPVEELFLDLLDYYCSFDSNQVITIRQTEILPFCEKMRLARLFNIQDPFIEAKNLGCVVSQTKANETRSVFSRARMLFRTPKKELCEDLENYFFSSMSLTGRILKEAFCDYCGNFGHNQKDCNLLHSPQMNKFFKPFPRRYQHVNRNDNYKGRYMKFTFHRKSLNTK